MIVGVAMQNGNIRQNEDSLFASPVAREQQGGHLTTQHQCQCQFYFEQAQFQQLRAGKEALREETVDMHRRLFGYTEEDSRWLETAESADPEAARPISGRFIHKRIEVLEERRRVQHECKIERTPKLHARKRADVAWQALIAAEEADCQQRFASKVKGCREAIVQGPNDKPLLPFDRDLAEEQMLDGVLRDLGELPGPNLRPLLENAHAEHRITADYER